MEALRKAAATRVQRQTDGLAADEVRQLSLTGVPFLPELFAPFRGLTHLTLVFMKPKLTSLAQLPLASLPRLRLLEVSDNAITVGEATTEASTAPSVLPCCPSLARLLLANNAIRSLEEVRALVQAFPELEVLDLADNPVDEELSHTHTARGAEAREPSQAFRSVFEWFPRLTALNARDANGDEVVVEDSDESASSTDEDEEEDEEEETDEERSDASADESRDSEDGSDGSAAAKRARVE